MKFFNVFFVMVGIFSGAVFADCSFKVINNNVEESFEEQGAMGTIGNLLIPRCSQNPSEDKETRENCAINAMNTLYEHPHEAGSCISTREQYIHIQFSNRATICKSIAPIADDNVILNFPRDFICNVNRMTVQ